MASAGTLLSELDAKGPSQDSDLVEKIMMDMNMSSGGSGGNSVQMPSRGMSAPPPPLPANASPGMGPQGMMQQGTSFPTASDPYPAQAHVIGRDHPTPADFAAAMHGVNRSMEPDPYATGPPASYGYEEGVKKNMYARILDEIKTPLIVSLLFFLFSLPAVNILVQHYVPSLLLPTGSMTMVGLLGKAVLVGASFWILTRLVAPLLKA